MSSPEYPPNIQTQDPVNRFRVRARRSSWPKVLGVLIAAVASMSLLWAVVAVALNSKPGEVAAGGNIMPFVFAPKDDGLTEVKEWLKENLHDPYIEVVRFWPKREMKEIWKRHEDYLIALENEQQKQSPADKMVANSVGKIFGVDENTIGKRLAEHRSTKPDVVCRLKYRTKMFGSLFLADQAFEIKDGRVVRAITPGDRITEDSYFFYLQD